MHTLLRIVVSLGVPMFVAGSSWDAHARTREDLPPDHSTSPTSRAIRVQVDPGIDDAALFPKWIAQRNPTLADELLGPGRRQWILVKLDGTTYDYQFEVIAMHDGEAIGPPTTPTACECNTETLLQLIDQKIARALPSLKNAADESNEPSPQPKPAPKPQPTIAEVEPCASYARSPRLRVAALASGAIGLVTLNSGISLLVAEEHKISARQYLRRDFDPLGIIFVTAGGGALVAGITMFAVDAVRRRHVSEDRSRASSLRTASTPSTASVLRSTRVSAALHRHGAVLSLTRSF